MYPIDGTIAARFCQEAGNVYADGLGMFWMTSDILNVVKTQHAIEKEGMFKK